MNVTRIAVLVLAGLGSLGDMAWAAPPLPPSRPDCPSRKPKAADFAKERLETVIRFLSVETCTSFIVPEKHKARRVTVALPDSLTREERLRRFISAVGDAGLRVALVDGRYLKICEPSTKSSACKGEPLY